MKNQTQLQDWFYRYGRLLDKRHTEKQKEIFIQSIIQDASALKLNAKIDEFKSTANDRENQNIYIGEISKADIIICTYYDTPSLHMGEYRFFSQSFNRERTLRMGVLLSLLALIIVFLFTLFIVIPTLNVKGIYNIQSVFWILLYIPYFTLLRKFTKGMSRGNNLIRNTSSILTMLELIKNKKDKKKIAYAFLDGGTTNKAGILRLKEKTDKNILFLDSIGSEHNLYLVSSDTNNLVEYPETKYIKKIKSNLLKDNQITYLISAQKDQYFYLNQRDLKANTLNAQNMGLVAMYLEKLSS